MRYHIAGLAGALCFIGLLQIHAQSLPNKQETSLRAPVNVKTDGKATEWGQFAAYNHATLIYYTMANDNDNLYFTFRATDPTVIQKIMMGGLTLSLQQMLLKDDKSAKSVTYPVMEHAPYFGLSNKKILTDTSARAVDSLMRRNNGLLDANSKWIRTSGIAGVDTLVSVYNTEGVHAAGRFDLKRAYTVEIAVALKYLNLSAANASKFNYHIRLNGGKVSSGWNNNTEAEVRRMNSGASEETIAMAIKMSESVNQLIIQTAAPTDFWGEYTLAKKP